MFIMNLAKLQCHVCRSQKENIALKEVNDSTLSPSSAMSLASCEGHVYHAFRGR